MTCVLTYDGQTHRSYNLSNPSFESTLVKADEFPQHTDAAMIEHFGRLQSSSKEMMLQEILSVRDPMTRPTSIAAAAVVLLVIIVVILRPGGDSDAVSATVAPSRGARLTALKQSSLPSAMPRRKAKLEPAADEAGQSDPYEEWDYSRILGEFMVPPMRIESADIGGVLRELRKTFAEYSGGRLLRIEARAAPSGEPGKGFAFDYAGGNLKQFLELVAAIGGYEVMIGEREVTLVGREPDTSNALVSKVYRVPPDFGLFDIEPEDPFAAPPVRTNDPRAAIEAFGIEVSEDVEFAFDPATATCAVSGLPVKSIASSD